MLRKAGAAVGGATARRLHIAVHQDGEGRMVRNPLARASVPGVELHRCVDTRYEVRRKAGDQMAGQRRRARTRCNHLSIEVRSVPLRST
jgi:hypothetical protein